MSEVASVNPTDVPAATQTNVAKEAKVPGQAVKLSKKKALPDYTKSLLRIQVPVVVALAEKKQELGRILELGPGMIIQFDKSCDEMLELEVGNQKIAEGEVVKVGDKFGLRITKMILPEEHFEVVKKVAAARGEGPGARDENQARSSNPG
jgi:flagellar motor switch protein FliN/FliY